MSEIELYVTEANSRSISFRLGQGKVPNSSTRGYQLSVDRFPRTTPFDRLLVQSSNDRIRLWDAQDARD